MEMYWQTVSVIVLVGLAVAYLVVRRTRRQKAKRACSNCPAVKRYHRST